MTRDHIFLILDDIDVNRVILKGLLSQIYKQSIIIEAASGTEAVQLHQDLLDSLYPIDAVFLDYHLPDIDGIIVAERLRANGYGGPMLMVTAVTNGDLKRLQECGLFCKVLRKPLSSRIIRQAVTDALTCHDNHQGDCPK